MMFVSYYTFLIWIWIVIYILIAILLIFLLLALRWLLPSLPITKEIIDFDPHTLNSGDIIAVSLNGHKSKFTQAVSGCIWVHAVIVYIDPSTKIKYILEGTHRGKIHPYSFYKIPLGTWIRYNRRQTLSLMKLNGGDDDTSRDIYNSFKPFIKYSTVEPFNFGWVRFLSTTKYHKYSSHHYQKGFTCVEACLRTLIDAGIFKKKYIESSYLLESILRCHPACETGYSYNRPVKLQLLSLQKSGIIY